MTCRYVSSQLESVASSKLGPLKLPSHSSHRGPQPEPVSPGQQHSKPRSSSAENLRSSSNREGGERVHKKSRDREAAPGTGRDKLQAVYSAAPRNKHQSVWTKENLLKGSKRAPDAEPVKETRASVSNDIRQVSSSEWLSRFVSDAFVQLASISSMLASAAPIEYRRNGPLPPTLDPRQAKNQNLRKSTDLQLPAVAHALTAHLNSNSNAVGSNSNFAKVQHVGQQPAVVPDDSRHHPSRAFIDPRSDANIELVRERLAALTQSFAAAHSNAPNASHQSSAHDRSENKQRKPAKPAPNAAPLGRLKTESSSMSLGSSVKGDDDWDEPDNGLLTLENFDQNGSSDGVILNSPRSIEVSAKDRPSRFSERSCCNRLDC